MSDSIKIKSYRSEYTVSFVEDYLHTIKSTIRERDVVFIDRGIFELYQDIAQALKGYRYRILDANEETKSFQALESTIDDLLTSGITKTDRLIAIGGGVIQDVTSFTASILFRGISWIFFPTNLLSQADSCIGSKSSINFKAFKNQLGGFYPPREIYIAPAFLKTLSDSEILSGLGEMMHYFCVSGDDDFAWAKEKFLTESWQENGFEPLIRRSLGIKKKMIETDEFDTGPRNVFNYGHSFGHALESATRYSVPHGIAVCYGMDLANCISVRSSLVSKEFRNDVRTSLTPVWEKSNLVFEDYDQFFLSLGRDKKNEGANIKVILTRGFGMMFKTTLVLDAEMKRFICEYFNNRQWEQNL